MKKRYIILAIILLIFSTTKTYASCTQEELNEFKKIENEYKVTYEFNSDTKDYIVTLHKPKSEPYTYLFDEKLNTNDNVRGTEESIIVSKVMPGEYVFKIYKYDDNCDDTLKTIEIKLPKYNAYFGDPLCEGIEEFYLCQQFYDKYIDRATFESRIDTYKKTKEEQNKQNTMIEDSKNENKILEYIQNNILQTIIIVIFIILVLITVYITTIQLRKSRRLEWKSTDIRKSL